MKKAGSRKHNVFAISMPCSRLLTLCLALLVSSSCSQFDEQQFTHYLQRGDQYVQQQQFAKAVIEYKNAARMGPNDVSIHWKLAQAALRTKDFQTAFAALQRTSRLDPNHYDAKNSLGQLYLAVGKTKESRQIAEELVVNHPLRPAGYMLRGHLIARDGDLAAAIAQFQEAVGRNPADDETMVAIGHLYLLQQSSTQALVWYDRALQTNPDSIEARVARGNYYFAAGQAAAGEMDFQTALDLGRDSEDMRLAIAVQHLMQGRPQHAEQELTAIAETMKSQKAGVLLIELKLELGKVAEAKALLEAIRKEKTDVAVTYLQGRIALAEQRGEEARTFLEAVVKRDPNMAGAHLYLGVLNLLERRRVPGEEQLLEAIRLDPASPKAHLVLAELYLNENSFTKAEEQAFEVLRRNPAHVQAAVLYADSFLLRDDWGRAESIYSSLLRQLPHSPIGPTKMAFLKRKQGFSSQAADYLAEAVKRAPADHGLMAEYLLALVATEKRQRAEHLLKDYIGKEPQDPLRWEAAGRVHLAMRQPVEAEKALKKAAELAADDPLPMYQLAHLYLSQNKPFQAEAAFRKVLEREEKHEAAHTSLGLLLATRGRTDEANDHYRRALELGPRNYVAANNLAADLLDRGADLDEALRVGKVALDAAPTVPAIQDTVGWIYFKKGALEEAYPLLTRAASELSDNPMVRFHHAMVLAKRGDKTLAMAELESALSLSRTFPGAEEAATTLASMRE